MATYNVTRVPPGGINAGQTLTSDPLRKTSSPLRSQIITGVTEPPPTEPYESFHSLSDVPTTTTSTDAQAIVNGVSYYFTQPGYVVGIRWYAPATIETAMTYEVGLYSATTDTTGTLLASKTIAGASITPNTWVTTMFDTPVAVIANKIYRTARLSPGAGYYVATPNVFITNQTNGQSIRGPQDNTNQTGEFIVSNANYQYSSTLTYPTQNFGTPDYFVDVLFTTQPGGGPKTVIVGQAIENDTAQPITRPSGGSPGGLINRTVGVAGRNGTTSHTITFTATQANSLLVAIVGGGVTTTWPSGWTERLQPANFTELSVATKVATAGETSVTITHNGSNYPVNYAIYEFATGSTYVTGTSAQNTGTWPNLTGLPGTQVRVFGAYNRALTNAITSVTATWSAPWTEDYTVNTPFATTDGSCTSIGYLDTSATSSQPTSTFNQVNSERVVFAINVASGSSPDNPTVVPGIARPVINSGSVVLDVTATPPAGQSITGHSWTIQSGGGSLTNANTATPTYTAPASGVGVAVIRDTVTASGSGTTTADVQVGYGPNIVAAENAIPGTTRSNWDLGAPNWAGVNTLQGFCDGFTANKNETLNFKISQSDTAGWNADIYRMGWYNGDGARYYGTLTPNGTQLTNSQSQPTPGDVDPTTTKLSADCSNWTTTLTWTPPSWAPSGFYILKLNRTGSGASHVMFILRDDSRTAKLMLMPSDSTWNAYNAFGGMGSNLLNGNSLYFGTALNQYHADCARFVSYNRPLVNRAAVGGGYGAVQWSTFFTAEYPMLRFIERNGFDVKYYGCIDAAGDPSGDKLSTVDAAVAVGHNEYWSDGMRAGWETAKANGKSLFFSAGNEVFWRCVGTDNDTSSRPRTWECQKSTIDGRGNTRPQWTGSWRDPDGVGKGGNNPENNLTGTIFVVNGVDLRSLVVPFNGGYSAQPLWRHTTVAALTSGQTWSSPNQILGFEWDTYGPAGVNTTGANFLAAPHTSAKFCSDVTYAVSNLVLTDAGDTYGSGNVTHRLVVHPGGNGAIVFGAGTVNWALGVDNSNVYQVGSDNTSLVLQQATVNMFVDMGATPTTLMSGLTSPTPQAWFATSSVTVNQASENDTPQPITRRKIKTIGQVTELDSVQPISKRKTKIPLQTSELDAAQLVTKRKSKTTALPVELDTAQAIRPIKRRTLVQVTETDTVTTTNKRKVKVVAQPLENNVAQPIAKPGNKVILQVTESDSAQSIRVVKRRELAQASELSLSTAITRRKLRTLGQPIESNVANPIVVPGTKLVNRAGELDIAQSITIIKRKTIGQVSQANTALLITPRRARVIAVNFAQEFGSVTAVSITKRKYVNLAQETNLARIINNLSILPPPPEGPIATVIIKPYAINTVIDGYETTVIVDRVSEVTVTL